MNRIDKAFRLCKDEDRGALVMFVSAGDPSLALSEELIPAIAEAGADIIELGVPFSDPMADGPAIQAASQRALAGGVTLSDIIAMVGRLREKTEAAFVLFSYYNVIMQYGVERLAADSAAAGIDGWLVVDVPGEEAGEVKPFLGPHDLHWITLLAPTTPRARAAELLADASGFVYYITVTGVTGARNALPDDLAEHLHAIRSLTDTPVVAGFGISSPDMARHVAAQADGVVVGSALIQTLVRSAGTREGIAECVAFVSALAAALRRGSA